MALIACSCGASVSPRALKCPACGAAVPPATPVATLTPPLATPAPWVKPSGLPAVLDLRCPGCQTVKRVYPQRLQEQPRCSSCTTLLDYAAHVVLSGADSARASQPAATTAVSPPSPSKPSSSDPMAWIVPPNVLKSLKQGCLLLFGLLLVLCILPSVWTGWRQSTRVKAATDALKERRFEDARRIADEAVQVRFDADAARIRDKAQAGLAGVEGMAALARGDAKAAFEGLSRASDAGVTDAEMKAALETTRTKYGAELLAKGADLTKAEKWREAITVLTQANRVRPTAEAEAALATAKQGYAGALVLQAADLAKAEKWKEAVDVLSKANEVERTPERAAQLADAKQKYAGSLYHEAERLGRADKWREALAAMTLANQLAPDPKAEPLIKYAKEQIAAQDKARAAADEEQRRQQQDEAAALRKESARTSGTRAGVGEEGWIFGRTRGDGASVASTPEAYAVAELAAARGNHEAFDELIEAGSIGTVPDGTRVLVRGREHGYTRVRILEGARKGQEVIVSPDFVKK